MAAAPGHDAEKEASEKERAQALQLLEGSGAPESLRGALRHLDEALRLWPNNVKARLLVVSCAMNLDDFERARDEGRTIYQGLTPKEKEDMADAVLHISIAQSAKMLGDSEEAISWASEAARLYPMDPHPNMILGELYADMGMNEEAERHCRKALATQHRGDCRYPLRAESVYFTQCCLGAALIHEEQYVEAEKVLKEAIANDAETMLAQRHLVDAYHFQHRHAEAIKLAEELAAKDPADEDLREKIQVMALSSDEAAGHRRDDSLQPHHPKPTGTARHDHASEELQHSDANGERDGAKKKEDGDFLCCCFDRSSKPGKAAGAEEANGSQPQQAAS